MRSPYASWIGQPVILQVAAEDLSVPLRGMIIEESAVSVRFQVADGKDFDIFKPMILAVEQEDCSETLVN